MWGVLSIVSVSVEGEGFGKDGVQTLPIHRIVLERSKSPDLRPKGAKAGRVGFEPTICGSAGRRLSPGSTTGPLVAEHGNHRLIINSDEQ